MMEDERMKKGPWTSAEDALLIEYVMNHGEGNWNHVQHNSPLARCGKSCRLRWANHLRPNLKKGSFSSNEQSLIIHLHSKLGNKWARMASFLPGRTDNEIKNFWNTRLKRCQRSGLPLYPPVSPSILNDYRFSNLQRQSSVPMLSSHVSPYASSSSSSTTLPNYHTSPAPLPSSFVFGFNSEISSSQTLPGFMASSGSASTIANNDDYSGYEISPSPLLSPQPNSGLLEDLLLESQALSRNPNSIRKEENDNVGIMESSIFPLSTWNEADGVNALLMEKEDDGDLYSMINNFTSQLPMTECHTSGEERQSMEIERQSMEIESQPETSCEYTDPEFNWAMENFWNNMPGMC